MALAKILLVEDDKIICDNYSQYLSDNGFGRLLMR